jgi:hypothetical protein
VAACATSMMSGADSAVQQPRVLGHAVGASLPTDDRDVEGQFPSKGQKLARRPGDELGGGNGHEFPATHAPHRTTAGGG